MFEKIYSAIFGETPSLVEACAKVGQKEKLKQKQLTDAFPELAPGMAKAVDDLLKDKNFAQMSEPVHVDQVTPENAAHVWGAIAAGNCMKFPNHSR